MTEFRNVREASAHLRVSKSLLDKLRLTGGGPRYLKLGARRVVYTVADLNAWAESGRRSNTSHHQQTA
jgi:predicted DNA-binding transcriptional regulator AlpA